MGVLLLRGYLVVSVLLLIVKAIQVGDGRSMKEYVWRRQRSASLSPRCEAGYR
jgi:hypothetical protein